MKSLPLEALRAPPWRRFGAVLALAASLGFAFQSTLVMAQATVDADAPAPVPTKPKAKAARKPAHKVMPSDNVADELNRREAERVAKLVQNGAQPTAPQPVPAVAAASAPAAAALAVATPAATPPAKGEPVPMAVTMPTARLVQAALTPTVSTPPLAAPAPAAPQPVALTPIATPDPASPSPLPRQAQARPPTPTPVPPPSTTSPAAPTVTSGGAPGRAFGQSQIVPPQQPTLTLEVQKGTAIKLPGAASTVFVASPDIADVQVKSPTMIYVFAKKPGDTVLYAVDDQDRVLLNTIVSVTSPISRMKGQLDALHPGNGIQIDNQGETIVLSGVSRSAVAADDARRIALAQVNNAASKVINNIRIEAPNQVQLKVKVAEVHREALKRIGVNWQNIASGSVGVAPLIGTAVGGGFAVATQQSIGGVPSAIARITGGNFDALIDFLATQNQATVLAEPNLVAMSGETANFLAGGEIPVIAPQAGSITGTFSVTYKPYGIGLSFTPTIVGDRINLKVAPEVSQVSTVGSVSVPLTPTSTVTVPAVQTRRASTTVELGSGQSFAIAGLLLRTGEQDIRKMPWLGDVPVLGTLFKSDAYQRAETELVIVVTPYFVEPTSGQLRTPLSNRVPPTDTDRLIMQRFNHPTPPQRLSVGREQYAGPSAGFTLE
jgi:pilus assembly protein CpaC